MKRYALLIEAARAKGQKEILGCERDVDRLQTWLKNPAGGAWNDSEIKVLHNPTKAQLASEKLIINRADFALLSFSGHGRIVENYTGHRRQMVTIGTGEEIDFDEMKPAVPKAIIICDACREVHRLAETREVTFGRVAQYAKEAKQYTRQDYRDLFERKVEAAAAGTFTMYSCSPGQCAGDDPLNGGVFTDALLNRAGDLYSNSRSTLAYEVESVFLLAKTTVTSKYPDQSPMAGPSNRSGNAFPFVVHLE